MFMRKKKSLEDYILTELQRGSGIILELIEHIKHYRPGTTKQGVYAALRVLQKQEIVLTHRGTASLNSVWLERLQEYCTIAQHNYYSATTGGGHVTQLNEGEKIQYIFRNPVTADAFWNHAIILLMETHPTVDPFVAYDPHTWFFIAHPENERTVRDYTVAHGRRYLIVSAAHTPLDRVVRSEFNATTSQYHIVTKPLFPMHYYLNIIGDFLIEVWFDDAVVERMEQLYQDTKTLTAPVQATFRSTMEQRGRMKLVISHDKNKAQRLKKKLLKYFYIPAKSPAQRHSKKGSKRAMIQKT